MSIVHKTTVGAALIVNKQTETCFPSFTTDQCIDVFQRIFGGSQVQLRVDETNRYYGGNNLVLD